MATQFKSLTQSLIAFIQAQPVFFVATAAPDGYVNVSPKGLDSLRVISDTRIIWLNLTGSGNETAAHVLEAPRMTLMFCAFEGEARIVRVFGNARVIHPADADWVSAIVDFPAMAGSRQVFDLAIEQVTISCGTGVPLMQCVKQRGPEELLPFYADMGPDGVQAYWTRKNKLSLNGKPTGI
jgi:predicted pyridoxine 5'-phosphate oxidase superfamily flavin-nucleotide-binding protein